MTRWGLTSYPRTGLGDQGGGSNIARVRTLLDRMRSRRGDPADGLADDLAASLEALSVSAGRDHAALVAVATEVRNVLYAAIRSDVICKPLHGKAMEVCARHWEAINPMPAKGNTPTGMLLYRLSALLGQDIGLSHVARAARCAGTGIVVGRGSDGTVNYFEGEAGRDIALFLKMPMAGSTVPLICVGTALGDGSEDAPVAVPPEIRSTFQIDRVDRRNPLYALSRAVYMAQDNGKSPQSSARREAGHGIIRAAETGNFLYLTVWSEIGDDAIPVWREAFECQ
jgi:hypothetical protein